MSRLLYAAKTPGADNPILIKFSRTYSIELHKFCTNLGHAPQILGFQRLPGGWCAVAMEYLEEAVPITDAPLLSAHRDCWTDEIQALVEGFHRQNLVHGDLRDVNILCKEGSVMLVDLRLGGHGGRGMLSHIKSQ